MASLYARLPWFITAPAVAAAMVAFGVIGNVLIGVYFERTTLNEADPLAGLTLVSNSSGAASGDGAILARGVFRDGDPGHSGDGDARIVRGADGSLVLRFEHFSVTNGPDLFVYLIEDETPSRAAVEAGINLGKLKATDGNVNYEIPAGTDGSKFKAAVIWCRQFRVNFAFAPLDSQGAPAAQASQPGVGTASPAASAAATSPTPVSAQAAASQASPTTPAAVQPTSAATPTATTPPPTPTTPAGPALLRQGTFKDGAPGHSGSGTAKIGRGADGKLVLVVENFSVTSGPDLHVILGPDANGGGSGIDLGKLKATDGTFSYAIPDGTDLSQFKSITIWCKSFPTIFAYATLEG